MHSAPQGHDVPRDPDAPEASGRSAAPHHPIRTGIIATTTAVVLGVLSVALTYAVVVSWRPLLDLDGSVARTLHRWAVADPALTRANRILSDWVWDPWTMRALCAALVVWLWWRGERRLAVWAGAACLVTTLLQQVLKAAVGRDRPTWPDPVDSAHFAAFPSGHAMTGTVVCGLFVWVLLLIGAPRAVRYAVGLCAVLSAIGVGLTRLWLGVHWPSDVVGGWLFGVLAVLVAALLYERASRAPRP